MGYTDIIGRSDVPVPEPIAANIIKEAIQGSVVLNRARRVPMSSKTLKQPVLSTLPDAYWVNGDTGLKQTTKASWTMPVITAEELAAIAVVPDAVFDDTNIDLWGSLEPLIAEAIGVKVDQAALFGTDKPASWPTAIVPGAVAAANTVTTAASGDYGISIAQLAGEIAANDGYDLNGFIAKPGFQWKLRGLRDTTGQPIYDAGSTTLYGFPMDQLKNGAWGVTTPATELIGVDWNRFFIGIRQDITVKLLDQAVLQNAAGDIVINLAQQDARALRVVFRVGFQMFKPVNRIGGLTGYPAGVVRAAA